MSRTGDHAEDTEHELEHAGREVAESFVDSLGEPEDPDEAALIDAPDEG
ncbi:MAG: hypothetical protein QG597_2925 [Actinomycetota bacterium]|nr:hypothetical protein [Actinomycetota bacterium]